jgi:hypothetical protein
MACEGTELTVCVVSGRPPVVGRPPPDAMLVSESKQGIEDGSGVEQIGMSLCRLQKLQEGATYGTVVSQPGKGRMDR